jgi:hypothetical protein
MRNLKLFSTVGDVPVQIVYHSRTVPRDANYGEAYRAGFYTSCCHNYMFNRIWLGQTDDEVMESLARVGPLGLPTFRIEH